MSGVAVVSSLLRGATDLTAIVPAESIKGGTLPEGVSIPALLVRSVSLNERQPLRRGAAIRTVERVSVTVRATNYREQRAVIALVRRICGGFVATEAVGVTNVSILTNGAGPDVIGPGNTFERTQDLRVSFDADA